MTSSHGPAPLAVVALEGTPEFQRFVEYLGAYVQTGESATQLREATMMVVAMCRLMSWGPTTIIIALHRSGHGMRGRASEATDLESRRYSTALDVLLYWYLQEG